VTQIYSKVGQNHKGMLGSPLLMWPNPNSQVTIKFKLRNPLESNGWYKLPLKDPQVGSSWATPCRLGFKNPRVIDSKHITDYQFKKNTNTTVQSYFLNAFSFIQAYHMGMYSWIISGERIKLFPLHHLNAYDGGLSLQLLFCRDLECTLWSTTTSQGHKRTKCCRYQLHLCQVHHQLDWKLWYREGQCWSKMSFIV